MKDDKYILHEEYAFGCETTENGIPILEKFVVSTETLSKLRPVAFNEISKELHPRECVAHFFLHDELIERFWNSPEKYIKVLKNYKFVLGTDYSVFSDLPKPINIFNTWRNRATVNLLRQNGIKCIPVVEWGAEDTWDFVFDGLPKGGTIAISTNGANYPEGRAETQEAFDEFAKRCEPFNVLCIGNGFKIETDIPVVYLESFSQQLHNRLGRER